MKINFNWEGNTNTRCNDPTFPNKSKSLISNKDLSLRKISISNNFKVSKKTKIYIWALFKIANTFKKSLLIREYSSTIKFSKQSQVLKQNMRNKTLSGSKLKYPLWQSHFLPAPRRFVAFITFAWKIKHKEGEYKIPSKKPSIGPIRGK